MAAHASYFIHTCQILPLVGRFHGARGFLVGLLPTHAFVLWLPLQSPCFVVASDAICCGLDHFTISCFVACARVTLPTSILGVTCCENVGSTTKSCPTRLPHTCSTHLVSGVMSSFPVATIGCQWSIGHVVLHPPPQTNLANNGDKWVP